MTEDLAWAITAIGYAALLALLIIGMTAMIIVTVIAGAALAGILAAFAVRAMRSAGRLHRRITDEEMLHEGGKHG